MARQEQPLAAVDRSYRGTYPSATWGLAGARRWQSSLLVSHRNGTPKGDIVQTPTEPDPSRQSRIMLTLLFLVALVVAGFVVGLVWWPELMPWSGR